MPAGDRQPFELLMDDEAWAAEPARVANEEFGHTVEWDPGTQRRWTCTRCDRVVICVGTNIYGLAVRERCEPELDA